MMAAGHLSFGKRGEDKATDFLEEKGYKILCRNFKTKIGEIDIIALDNETLCFIEVKARRSLRFGLPQEAVSTRKQRQISKAALAFLKEKKFLDKKARFDVLSIFYSSSEPNIELTKNAFELDNDFVY